LGVTLQESVLLEALTPEENLRVFGRYHLLRDPELSRRARELVVFFELGSHARQPVRQLSGGLRRRLAIALSLMNGPELLILDEPTTGLDPQVRRLLWARIRELRAAGTTVLLTTHYMDEAERVCDRLAIVNHGRLVALGSPDELIRGHAAREALELELPVSEEAALLESLGAEPRRLRSGSSVTFYVDDAAALVARLRRFDGGERRPLVVRPANLEDVFLALTGTSLEGDA
jgi:lipooligosaccharide transport system ATP-binding protein